jgi:hypothetical protein
VVSNESGRYNAAFLQPGTYELTFSLSGFQPVVLKNVELHVNDRLDINQKLGVSQVSETVEVSAASQFVQPSPSVQNLLGPEQVQELPLNNRNFVQLATLVPGVSSDLGDEVGIGLTSTISISINGGRRNAVNWLVDGVSNVDVGSNVTLLATPTLESIQEFKIITSSYAAEWPRSGGGIVNIVTKSGGRSFAGTAYEFYRNDSLNANQQWNVGVQRQLYRRGFMDVSYVGSRGDNLIQPVDINQPQPADVVRLNSLNLARPFLGYGTITMRQTTARSRYWGLLTQFRHEAGRAGSVTLNYTLSRNRTTSTNDRDAIDIPQNPLDLDIEYADARTDRRHIFSATYIYEVPFFRNSSNAVLKAALGGWQVSGITNLHSGAPLPRITANTNGGRRGGRANQVGDPREGELSFPFWFDPAAFAPPADGTYGNSVRAPFRLPGRNQTDLALSKNLYPWGRRLQFRSDFINAFNQTQYLAVDAACSAANTVTLNRCDIGGTDTFGQITSARLPREIQLSLKLFW